MNRPSRRVDVAGAAGTVIVLYGLLMSRCRQCELAGHVVDVGQRSVWRRRRRRGSVGVGWPSSGLGAALVSFRRVAADRDECSLSSDSCHTRYGM
jgi:hypothetical protein